MTTIGATGSPVVLIAQLYGSSLPPWLGVAVARTERAVVSGGVSADTVSLQCGTFATSRDRPESLTFAEMAARRSEIGVPITYEIHVRIAHLGEHGGEAVLFTVVDDKGSAPASPGAKMLMYATAAQQGL